VYQLGRIKKTKLSKRGKRKRNWYYTKRLFAFIVGLSVTATIILLLYFYYSFLLSIVALAFAFLLSAWLYLKTANKEASESGIITKDQVDKKVRDDFQDYFDEYKDVYEKLR
jgi:Flp pilus assembly protein TadB